MFCFLEQESGGDDEEGEPFSITVADYLIAAAITVLYVLAFAFIARSIWRLWIH